MKRGPIRIKDMLVNVLHGQYDDLRTFLKENGISHSYVLENAIAELVKKDKDVRFSSYQFYYNLWQALDGTPITFISFADGVLPDVKIFANTLFTLPKAITHMNLSKNKINEKSVRYLADALPETKIAMLDLSFNDLSIKGIKYLADRLSDSDTGIVCLDVSKNNIQTEGAKYLADRLPSTKISNLILDANNIQDKGAKYLSEALLASKLKSLSLTNNGIQAPGGEYFARTLPACQPSDTLLFSLRLDENIIGTEGTTSLVDANGGSLSIQCCGLRTKGARRMASAQARDEGSVVRLWPIEITHKTSEYLTGKFHRKGP